MKRYKNIVGKYIGGNLYVHRQYADMVVPRHKEAAEILHSQFPGFQYNAVVWDTKKETVRFCSSPDFDTSSEPVVGLTVTVDLADGSAGRIKEYKQIWHRKELWVKQEDYSGFDVAAAERWSLCWSSKLAGKETANGSSRVNWLKQLDRFGIAVPQ